MNDVAIIIPSFRWEPFTRQCIETCATMYPDAQIILILNEEFSADIKIPDNVEIHYFQENNIAKRRNFGVSKTCRSYLGFIDSDAYPASNWLEEAIQAFSHDIRIGATGGPNISPPNEPHGRLWVGMSQTSWLIMGFWLFYKSENSKARYADNLPSCNLVVKRDVYTDFGGMNEGLETGEDTDFCAKLLKNGYKIRFAPKAVVYHYDRSVHGFLKQRIVRGIAVYHHLFGNSARRGRIKDLMFLQPVAIIVIVMIFLSLGMISGEVMKASGVFISVFLIIVFIEGVRCSHALRDIIPVTVLICLGNLFVGFGFLMQAFKIKPRLISFYRNDC